MGMSSRSTLCSALRRVILLAFASSGCSDLTPLEFEEDTFFDEDVDMLFVAAPKSQIMAIITHRRHGLVVFRDGRAADDRCDGVERTVACEAPDGVIGSAVMVLPDGSGFEVEPSATTLSLRGLRAASGTRALSPDTELDVAVLDSVLTDAADWIDRQVDRAFISAQPFAQRMKLGLSRRDAPAPEENWFSSSETAGCFECRSHEDIVESARFAVNGLLDVLLKPLTANDGPYEDLWDAERWDTGDRGYLPSRSSLRERPGFLGVTGRIDMRTTGGPPLNLNALAPSAEFTCAASADPSTPLEGRERVEQDQEVTCTAEADADTHRMRWEFGPLSEADQQSPPPENHFSYDGKSITFRGGIYPFYAVRLKVTDRNTRVSKMSERMVFEVEAAPEEEEEEEDGNFFVCRSGGLCGEYTIESDARAAELRSQCAAVSTEPCDRSGAKTCRFTASGQVNCTVTPNAPSDHDATCREYGGTPGC